MGARHWLSVGGSQISQHFSLGFYIQPGVNLLSKLKDEKLGHNVIVSCCDFAALV